MASQVKLTVARGAHNLKDVTVAAGTAIAGSDAMELNIDVTRLTKAEALELFERLWSKIYNAKWPMA